MPVSKQLAFCVLERKIKSQKEVNDMEEGKNQSHSFICAFFGVFFVCSGFFASLFPKLSLIFSPRGTETFAKR